MSNELDQKLKDTTVAVTQWLDAGKDNVESNVKTRVEQNIKVSNTQKCVEDLSGSQLVTIKGNDNVAANIVQKKVATGLLSCIQNNSNTAAFVQNTTNTVNQHSDYESKNPLSFLTDALEAILKTAIGAAVVTLEITA